MFRRTALITAATVVAVGLTLTGCSAGGTTTAADAGTSGPSAAAPKGAGLNTPVKAGTFEYTAIGVKDVGTTVGTSPLSQTAQGTFIQVDLKIANVGNASNTFISSYVKLVDASGKTYDSDPTATLYANPDQSAWVAAINPGNAIQGPIVFDVPANTKPVNILVSDNMFGKGETINLG